MIRAFGRNENPDIGFVWEWFEFQIALLGESHADVLRRLMSLEISARPHEARLVGLTPEEVSAYFDAQRNQLNLLTMFELLATTEAILRIDFNERVALKKKDRLSRRYRELDRSNGDNIRLAEDLLTAMKDAVTEPKVVSDFLGVLNLRNWLAHGRYWHPKLGRGYTPNDVFDVCRDLILLIPPL